MSAILDLCLPDTCVLCTAMYRPRSDDLLCDHCRVALPYNTAKCSGCAEPGHFDNLCGRCQIKPLTTGDVVVPLRHEGCAAYLMGRFKFSNGQREGRVLAETLARALASHYQDRDAPDCIIPVPLSWLGHVRRGYNQAAVIAHYAASRLQIDLRPQALARRHSKPQRSLSRTERERLPSSRFLVRDRSLPGHIALVDDVLTTGSTIRAVAKRLQGSGVQRIDVWCATRAVLR